MHVAAHGPGSGSLDLRCGRRAVITSRHAVIQVYLHRIWDLYVAFNLSQGTCTIPITANIINRYLHVRKDSHESCSSCRRGRCHHTPTPLSSLHSRGQPPVVASFFWGSRCQGFSDACDGGVDFVLALLSSRPGC